MLLPAEPINLLLTFLPSVIKTWFSRLENYIGLLWIRLGNRPTWSHAVTKGRGKFGSLLSRSVNTTLVCVRLLWEWWPFMPCTSEPSRLGVWLVSFRQPDLSAKMRFRTNIFKYPHTPHHISLQRMPTQDSYVSAVADMQTLTWPKCD